MNQLTTYRFFMDIDAADLDAAKIELENRAANMGSFGDLDVTEIQMEKFSHDEIMDHLKINPGQILEGVVNHFYDYDAWVCKHCGEATDNETGSMLGHLRMHTKEELLVDSDGDLLEDDEE